MPIYEYHCKECSEKFEIIERLEEHEKSKPKCPKCGSEDVAQVLGAFTAVTSKKS